MELSKIQNLQKQILNKCKKYLIFIGVCKRFKLLYGANIIEIIEDNKEVILKIEIKDSNILIDRGDPNRLLICESLNQFYQKIDYLKSIKGEKLYEINYI